MAKIKCFQCEKEIGIQDRFCPHCSAEQLIAAVAQHPPQTEPEPTPEPDDTAPPATPKQESSVPPPPPPPEQESSAPPPPPPPEQENQPAEIQETPAHVHKGKKRKKKSGNGCGTILGGVLALLVVGFIVKVTLIDEKSAGIKLDGPGTYGRAPTGKTAGEKNSAGSIIATIKALQQKGKLDQALKITQQALEADGKNIKLMALLVQVTVERSEEVGNELPALTPSRHRRQNKSQKSREQELKTAVSKLLTQLKRPCAEVSAMESTKGKDNQYRVTCRTNPDSLATSSYAMDSKAGTAWAE